jgi:hypothetical protein
MNYESYYEEKAKQQDAMTTADILAETAAIIEEINRLNADTLVKIRRANRKTIIAIILTVLTLCCQIGTVVFAPKEITPMCEPEAIKPDTNETNIEHDARVLAPIANFTMFNFPSVIWGLRDFTCIDHSTPFSGVFFTLLTINPPQGRKETIMTKEKHAMCGLGNEQLGDFCSFRLMKRCVVSILLRIDIGTTGNEKPDEV